MPDPTPDVPRRTLPAREAITFARGSVADARRALAAARPASRSTPDPGAAVVQLTENAPPARRSVSEPFVIAARTAIEDAITAGRTSGRNRSIGWYAKGTAGMVAGWLTELSVSSPDAGPADLVGKLRDYCDAAAAARPRIYTRAVVRDVVALVESLAASWCDSCGGPAGMSRRLDEDTSASLARGLAQSAAGDVRDRGDFPATIPPPISWASSVLGEVPQYADDEPGELIGEARPHCQDPSCPDFGDPNFGEGTCPASHAEPRDDEQRKNRLVQGAKLLWAADRGDVAPWMFDKLTDPDLLDLCIMARRLIQATHRERNRRRAEPAGRVPQ